MSYCTGFVLGNVIMGSLYLMFKNKMNHDNHDEQPSTQAAAQNDIADDTNSTISESSNCNTIDNNSPEISIRYENILTATANYANLLNNNNNNNNNNEMQEESIEYELTDYMLQNDIETIHSMNSSLRSSRSSIDAPSYSQQEDDNLQLSYSQESVYNNFDDLFEIRDSWMSNNTSGSISLETDTIIVGLDRGDEARDDNDREEIVGSVSKEGEIVDMGIKDKPNAMPTAEEEGEDGAEILKKLVIKCLVRNNCKGGLAKGKSSPRSVRSSRGEKEKKIFPSLPKDPSLEDDNRCKDPNSRQDPPSAEETSQKYQEQMYEQQQHQQGSSRVGCGGGMSVSSINSNRYPPRPDIVRYNNNMIMMQSRREPQYKQQPPRPDLIQCNILSAPLSRCHSSYSYSTHAHQVSPRSLPGVVELSPVIEEANGVGSSYVIGQGELRRRHYKELLRQQRQKELIQQEASPLGCSDSTMIPTKDVPTLV